jgi:hypothetical protein
MQAPCHSSVLPYFATVVSCDGKIILTLAADIKKSCFPASELLSQRVVGFLRKAFEKNKAEKLRRRSSRFWRNGEDKKRFGKLY